MDCIKCGKETSHYPFHVLQVLTLHVRDLKGDKRIQALGDFEDYAVCRDCAQTKLDTILNNRSALLRGLAPFAAAQILGIVLAAVTWNGEGVLRLLGLAMTVCGLLGLTGTWQRLMQKKRAFSALSPEDALHQAAWDVLLDNAPKKYDINDITYIPIDEHTLARKNGDLMLLYNLLPEIAVQAYNRIHGPEEAGE